MTGAAKRPESANAASAKAIAPLTEWLPGCTCAARSLVPPMENGLLRATGPVDNYHFERLLAKRGFNRVAGTDEVGRGPLAGPVVAATVILPESCTPAVFIDSKKTSKTRRYQLRDLLLSHGAAIGVGIIAPEVIDRVNILQASLLAMKQSFENLVASGAEPDYLLVDGTCGVPLTTPQETLIKGDSRSASIAAASIIAKITRDEIMDELHRRFPHYNFLTNKGYPTREHRLAISKYGPCPVHRNSFKGVKEFVLKAS